MSRTTPDTPRDAHDRHRDDPRSAKAPVCQLYRANGRLVMYVARLSDADFVWLRDAMLANGQGDWYENRAKAGAFLSQCIPHYGSITIDLHREDIDAFVATVSYRLGCEVHWLEAPPDWPR